MTSGPRPTGRASERDRALGRLRRISRWLAVATVAAVGAVTAYVAGVLPGHAAGASTGRATTQSPAAQNSPTATEPSPGGDGTQGVLSAPQSPPTTTQGPQQASSGSTGW